MVYKGKAAKSDYTAMHTGKDSLFDLLSNVDRPNVEFAMREPSCLFFAVNHGTDKCIYAVWPRGYKTLSRSTQLSITFIMLINVKSLAF